MADARTLTRTLAGKWLGSYGMALCPCHDDKSPSLSIRDGDKSLLFKCHAGCDSRAVVDKLRDRGMLNGADPAHKANGHAAPKVAAIYDYLSEDYEPLYQVVRLDPKGFRQRRSDGNGGWEWSLGDIQRVPYRLPEIIEAVKGGKRIYIAEGEKAVDRLVELGLTATCSPGGAGKWRASYSPHLRGADVVILADNDDPGEQHAASVASSLAGIASRVRVLRLPGLPEKGDVFDWLASGGTVAELERLAEAQEQEAEPPIAEHGDGRLRPLDIHEFFRLNIPPRQMLLDPIIPEKGLVMLYASRGLGKTFFACGVSYAVATGTAFLKWTADKPRKVLHVDGEMAAVELRERLGQLMSGCDVRPGPGMLNILTADLIECGIGNLASPKVQEEIDALLDGVELLVLDNLSSLTSVIRDNDAESWNPIQEWLLRLRRRGVSVLLVHHAGKGGEQRGTSRREDVLDVSLSLRRPSDYQTEQGARFEVHFAKTRGVHGDKAKPFEAQFEVRDEAATWSVREIEDVSLARVKALLDEGLTVREIADETGIPRSTVGRLKKQAEMGQDAGGMSRAA